MVLLNEHATPPLNSLIYDVLFRPAELEDIPMWDQFEQYEKVRKNKSSQEDDDDVDDEAEAEPGVYKVYLVYYFPYTIVFSFSR
jgi:hypothetical protein